MSDADDVRAVALALPRTEEHLVRGRWKFRIKSIVYTSLSADERDIGLGFPKQEREAAIAERPDTFFSPRPSDLRFNWICAHLDALDRAELRELITDAWRMCVPKMLHDLPELPVPAAAAWWAMDDRDWGRLRPLLDPEVQLDLRGVSLRGRSRVMAYLADHPTPRPPAAVEVDGGRITRWTGAGRARY